MLFDGQEDGVVGGDKGMVPDSIDHIHEVDLCGQGSSVINDGLPFWSVPAVHWREDEGERMWRCECGRAHVRCSGIPFVAL